ncbi:hypothetical protein KP509_38G050800 [Ceratopteris richardii]|uniref:Uncharacterized protein n=1 Tax=Ceratopteris richardii TaxID=49495 RepID=A0A8T2Q4U2_CERRI|nr:hypothetical protein KP509_38G050800 [Ceratopteris richardii]
MAMASMEALAIYRPSPDTVAVTEPCCVFSTNRSSVLASSRRISCLSASPKGSTASIFRSPFLGSINSHILKGTEGIKEERGRSIRFLVASSLVGQDPEWSQDDYLALGLAHCFQQVEGGKLKEVFLVEPVPASTLECLENGGATSFVHVTGSTLGVALKEDVSLLPPEFEKGQFCRDFDFRAKCASRTWKRPHAVNNLRSILPVGSVRSEYNFSLSDKRIINKERVVTDADNIKQDMSIDVYGRSNDADEQEQGVEIASLYNA